MKYLKRKGEIEKLCQENLSYKEIGEKIGGETSGVWLFCKRQNINKNRPILIIKAVSGRHCDPQGL